MRTNRELKWASISLQGTFMAHSMTSVEVCAGAGGQALGLEKAGFSHEACVEIEKVCCETLRANRPKWSVFEEDLNFFNGAPYKGADLFAGGLPCPPFSIAGKQLGANDERNLFPAAIRLISEIKPQAVMIENVKGIMSPAFDEYRQEMARQFDKLGYEIKPKILNASNFGVSQLRPRVMFVALRHSIKDAFRWPSEIAECPPTVGEKLFDLMTERGWKGALAWRRKANSIAPTLVGGSKKHGGPDLGPTRAKRAWAELGVDGMGIANEAPEKDFEGNPRLTVRMCARLQGFDDEWEFSGRKTAAYRQVGNAFPPPVAYAVALEIRAALEAHAARQLRRA